MIRHELGANVLLLGPWSFKHRSHTQFLQTAEANDLQVIPSFDLRWYWEGGKWGEAATREALKEDFHDFLQYSASVSNEKLSTPDTILMWNLMGLPAFFEGHSTQFLRGWCHRGCEQPAELCGSQWRVARCLGYGEKSAGALHLALNNYTNKTFKSKKMLYLSLFPQRFDFALRRFFK